ncbi:MAG: short-chain dehydrogenase [Gemmatales bacterium]|nr:MAG: short-chain dehydrogenase [Gemmatales bacterium]
MVTGASRGIGLAVAHALARSGASLAITGRKADALEAAADLLRSAGAASVLPVPCHQGESEQIRKLFDTLDAEGFAADAVVVNAGTNPIMAPLVETEPSAWQKIFDVNVTGAWLTAALAARRMKSLGQGSIVLMTSVAGLDPIPGLGAYSVSKTALIGLTKALAKELGPEIRVNAVAPGLIETRFSAALFHDEELYHRWISSIPLKRHGQPEDVVGAVLFLISNDSAYMTGQVLVVDGGGRV